MRMNSAMARILGAPLPSLNNLSLDLQETLDDGWTIGPAQSLLFMARYGDGWGDWTVDAVAHMEREINDVYIESRGLPTNKADFQSIMAARVFTFAIHAMLNARSMEFADKLVCVISIVDDEDYLTGGTTANFFTRRGDYPAVCDGDLETYRLEAMVVFDMRDAERWPVVLDEAARQRNLLFGT